LVEAVVHYRLEFVREVKESTSRLLLDSSHHILWVYALLRVIAVNQVKTESQIKEGLWRINQIIDVCDIDSIKPSLIL
jgi:hypothetical protein